MLPSSEQLIERSYAGASRRADNSGIGWVTSDTDHHRKRECKLVSLGSIRRIVSGFTVGW